MPLNLATWTELLFLIYDKSLRIGGHFWPDDELFQIKFKSNAFLEIFTHPDTDAH